MMNRATTSRSAGFSLIELLVSMAIGLIVTLAITSVLIRSEGSKRSSTSVNDINQSGAYAAYVLDRAVRSAGSGFSQRWSDVYGCVLDVTKSGTAVLPVPAAIPASSAFRNVATAAATPIRLAPLIIGQGQADVSGEVRGDVLIVMAGTAGVGESPQGVNAVDASSTPAQVQLPNTLGYRTADMLLLWKANAANGCMMQQAAARSASEFGQVLQLAGNYTATAGTNVNLSDFGSGAIAMQLGRDLANPPQFQAYAVGANRTLVSYDLLQPIPTGGIPDTPIADGIVEMRAVYGIDTSSPPDGTRDDWTDASGNYSAANLSDGSAASRARLRGIVSVRIGLILRTSLQERTGASFASAATSQETYQASSSTLTLFSDLPSALQRTRTLGTADAGYRFRTVEITIPLRNVLLAPQS